MRNQQLLIKIGKFKKNTEKNCFCHKFLRDKSLVLYLNKSVTFKLK